MNTDDTLADLGWSKFFKDQLTDEDAGLTPMRVTAVHRHEADVVGEYGQRRLPLPFETVAIGDWVLADNGMLSRVLQRQSVLQRRAAGDAPQAQLLAANIDTVLIVTSCNADFNPARLERYLALARQSAVVPVIVLTKADLCKDEGRYVTEARQLMPDLDVLAVDATAAEVVAQLAPWCGPGQSVVLLGSSGVGKSTLANQLTGAEQATQDIREDDARGRHTTTARSMHKMSAGGWLIDTPGMRALALYEAAEGVAQVFADLADLAAQCRFSDCAHETEPGCAIQAAVQAGHIDQARVGRWFKLQREEMVSGETVAERHARARKFNKYHKAGKKRGEGKRGN